MKTVFRGYTRSNLSRRAKGIVTDSAASPRLDSIRTIAAGPRLRDETDVVCHPPHAGIENVPLHRHDNVRDWIDV